MITNDCPSENELGRYAAGDLSDAEAETIDTHIGYCTVCLNRLDTLSSEPNSLIAALRRPAESVARPNPNLLNAVAAVLQSDSNPSNLPTSETNDVAVGTAICGYIILGKLGHGGMGRVYRARHPRLEQDVAIKVLRPGYDSERFVARFEAERQTLAMMDHPHIARVIDGGMTDQGQPYFVMELVSGTTITRYCDEHSLSLNHCLELFVEVCQAVQHAHQKGMIHRDLKPSNVMITEYDGTPTPKVIDFGIAKAIEKTSSTETEVGTLVGTLEYMSPEQAGLSIRDMDTRSDIYALGVLLYELLTGDTPLSRQRIRTLPTLEVLRLIREEDPSLPSQTLAKSTSQLEQSHTSGILAKDVRGELDWITMKALEKDRSQRYESAAALADDVRRFLEDDLVHAGPRNTAYRMKKFVRRNRSWMATVAAFAVLLVAGTVISVSLAVQARDARNQAETERDQARVDRDRAEVAGQQAKDSAAEALAVLNFFRERVLAAGRPEGQEGGLGRDVTIRQAVDAAEPHISAAFLGQPLAEAAVRNTLGTTYVYVGDPVAAVEQFKHSSALRRERYGADHLETLGSNHDLGIATRQAGQIELAISIFEDVRQKRTAQLGSEHRDVLETMRELAVTYREAGKIDQATELAAEAVAGLTATVGPDDIETLLTKSCLASSYQAASKYKPAVELYDKVLYGMTTQVGGEHPYTLASMNNLGLAYRADGQLSRASPLFEKAMEIQKRLLGPDHLHTLTSMNNLAMVYLDQGQAAKAIPLLSEVLEGRTAKLGPDHPATFTSMHSLANAYQSNGQADLAFPLLKRALEFTRSRLGPDHPDTLNAMNNYAAMHFFAGKVDEAIDIHEETLKLRTAKFGDAHVETLVSMNNLAYCYWKAKKIDLSLDLFERTVKGRKLALGLDHPETLNAITTLSRVYRDVGKLDQSLSLLESELADRQSRLGETHTDTRRLAKNLAVVRGDRVLDFIEEQKFVEAEDLLGAILKVYSNDPDTWQHAVTQSLLGSTLAAQKKYAEAEPLLLRSYEGLLKHESQTPAKTAARRAEALDRIIQLYEAWGKPEEVAKWRK